MPKQVPIKAFDDYVKKIMEGIQLEEQEKKELTEEWKQHLYDHYAALRSKNTGREEAIETVIHQFGPVDMLQEEVNHTFPGSIKNHTSKQIFIAVICIAASLIGPAILIGAHFQTYLIGASVIGLLMAYLIYQFVIKQQTYWVFSIIGFTAIYTVFLQFLPRIFGTTLTMELYVNQLFTLEWSRLTGMNGLFEFVTLHMMWYILVIMQFFTTNNYVPVWQRICNSTFHYWAMLLVGLFIAQMQTSAEWSVLFLNVFLLYIFLEQIISVQNFVVWKEKISRLLAE